MCLKGSLEDFSILDVLQLVSLGGNTGYLFLETPAGCGTVLFRRGRVLGSVENGIGPVARGLEAIRAQTVELLHRLARPRRGRFRFESESAPVELVPSDTGAPERVRGGIDVIALLLDLASLQEDDGRCGTVAPPVLLVDDEEQVRRFLAGRLVAAGYRVVEARDVESAVKTGARLGGAGRPFVLVTDVDMPAGNSFRGGFELVKRLARLRLKPPVVMMAHDASSSLRAIPKRRTWSVVRKPGLSKLEPAAFDADMRALAARMVDEILPRLCAQ
jgi:CheY-like chemotaxis protein